MKREVSMVKVSQSESIPVRTLRSWVKQFSEKGISGLKRTKRKDSGSSRILTPELTGLIQSFTLQKPPLSISAIHRKAVLLSQRSNLKPPSYETVYGIVKKNQSCFTNVST
ncbi:MAG: helix-turn-helix domain-containing protein [Hymenobacter sp.]|nr:MAG: helix-turn-helix domain-containing protein [Hymenobacter sp.]